MHFFSEVRTSIQGSPVKLRLILRLISQKLCSQNEKQTALFLCKCSGYNFIYCHFYDNRHFHTQNWANGKALKFSSHGHTSFRPYCERRKGGNFARSKKVGCTFCVITQKRNKIRFWILDMLFLNDRAFKWGILHSDRTFRTMIIFYLKIENGKMENRVFCNFLLASWLHWNCHSSSLDASISYPNGLFYSWIVYLTHPVSFFLF